MAEASLIADQAIAWHLRLPELPGHEWPTFIEWLESSSAHRDAYERLAEADAVLGEAAPALGAAAGVAAAPTRYNPARRRWLTGAIAASIALVGGWTLWPGASSLQLERTAPGTIKQLAFADGTRVELNGDSALALDQSNPRAMKLENGEAMFRVRHLPQEFTVEAGGYKIRDLGTVFNVQLSDRNLRIDVSEGSVEFDPGGANLTLHAGEGMTLDRAHGLVVKRSAANAGGWVNGQFAFADTPLSDVAEAIRRRFGTKISLSEGLSARPFTGNIRLGGNESEDVAHFAGLIGAQYRRDGDNWVISEGRSR
ncbi:FecR domain-containing protein [Novosphingobium flavum]|uniref:FecR domain-containing protein n=1 Tax=Novosphingobium flavum TaxID=1778672 RepID=A0A7X1KK10_9SPHN|nr:FecR family protein [Novosphingobium flavum]MBC2664032.1 FecR domain-containing protein [Novosphingobium flavum]